MSAMEIVDTQWLRRWPLPQPAADGDKACRGRLLVVAGCAENPGAALLCANAALRAGVGKLTVVTASAAAMALAVAVPEARVVGLPPCAIASGEWDEQAPYCFDAARAIAGEAFDAAVIGPGLLHERQCGEFVRWLLPQLDCPRIVLDAAAMAVRNPPTRARVLITPHAGEMAHLCGTTKDAAADNRTLATAAAARWNTVVALKAAGVTLIATPEGRVLRHEGGNIGLAVSGSGDVLAGIAGALAARGAELEQAAAWAVYLHAAAGDRLARRGALGLLPRELPAEIPALAQQLGDDGAAGDGCAR